MYMWSIERRNNCPLGLSVSLTFQAKFVAMHLSTIPKGRIVSVFIQLRRMAGERSMTLRMETAEHAHRANIARYQKILATYLTADERRFVECRIAEEQAALHELAWSVTPECQSTHAA